MKSRIPRAPGTWPDRSLRGAPDLRHHQRDPSASRRQGGPGAMPGPDRHHSLRGAPDLRHQRDRRSDAGAGSDLSPGQRDRHGMTRAGPRRGRGPVYIWSGGTRPVRDVDVPGPDFERRSDAGAGEAVRDRLCLGFDALIRCRERLGRARFPAELGEASEDTIEKVRASRAGTIETPEQEHHVRPARPVPPAKPPRTDPATRLPARPIR